MTQNKKPRKIKAKPSEMLGIAMAKKKAIDEKKALKAAKELQEKINAQIKADKKPAKETTEKKVRISGKTGKKVTVTTKHKAKKGKTRTAYQLKKIAAMQLDKEVNKEKYAKEREEQALERKAYEQKLQADKKERIAKNPPKYNTTQQAVKYFSKEDKCNAALEEAHKVDGVLHCAYCNHDKVYRYKTRPKFKCAKCRRQFSVTTNTFLSKSKIDIETVFEVVMRETTNSTKYKVSQLRQDFGFSHKTAVNLLYKIRSTAFNQNLFKIEENSRVSMDTTAIIGSDVNRHDQNKLGKKKTYELSAQALTMKQENGKTLIKMIPNLKTASKRKVVLEFVPLSCSLTTDEHRGFNFIAKAGYKEWSKVNHNLGENARGRTSSNGAESVHASLKTALKAHFNSINRKYLQQFMNAIVFYKNTIDELTYEERFNLCLKGIAKTKKPIKIKPSEQKLLFMSSNNVAGIKHYQQGLKKVA